MQQIHFFERAFADRQFIYDRPLQRAARLRRGVRCAAKRDHRIARNKDLWIAFAQCALDQAACDLWGKLQGAPVYKLWGLSAEKMPLTDYTIGIDSVAKMVAKMREFPDWPIYKIKLGTQEDLEIVRELRRHTRAVFRVDANCRWPFWSRHSGRL